MENEIMSFEFNGTEVRTVIVDGEPWWVLKDVCNVLDIKNPKDVQNRLDPDEVGRFDLPHPQNPEKTIEIVCINEPGLYSVIFRSDKPQAKDFKRKVTHEILPEIRKHGFYDARSERGMQSNDIDDLKARVEKLEENIRCMRVINISHSERLDSLELAPFLHRKRTSKPNESTESTPKEPKYSTTPVFTRQQASMLLLSNAKTLTNITTIAEHYGLTGAEMNSMLADFGIQYKDNDGVWKLTSPYVAKHYAEYRFFDNPDCPQSLYWTRCGISFLYQFLEEHSIYPIQ